jgi:probable HAF family extracellular repeat protein
MQPFLFSVAAGSLLAALATAQSLPRYTVKDLGTLGGSYSYAWGVNNAGVVAGGAATPTQTGGVFQTAFLFSGGRMHNLGTLGGASCPDCNSEAGGPNASGAPVLISETFKSDPNGEDFCGFHTGRQCLGAILINGKLTPLDTLPGGNNTQAYWINNRGETVGFSETHVRDSACLVPDQKFRFEAVRWGPDGRVIQRLPPLEGDTVSFGFGINESGETVGVSGLCSNTSLPPNSAPGGPHAVRWDKNGSVHNLGALPGGAGNNVASSINNRGDVVGTSLLENGTVHAFLWTRQTGMHDLGLPNGDFASVAPCCNAINNRNDVVGFSCPGPKGGCRAIAWQDRVPVDLNELIPANSPWYLQAATSVNDAGEIAGYGLINGETHGFLATPVPGK